ncbi:MAG: nitroreductase family protein [Spirochaetes bacterium]|nr:nitroreductase family protein [Spirochaetota bacterium]
MDFEEIVKKRRSIRKYKNKKIEDEKIKVILEAARLAPSAKNEQNWKFIVVNDPELKEKIAIASYNQFFIKEADIVIVACATDSSRIMACGQPAYTVDLSIAMTFMICQAFELGLGTCWIGAFDEQKIKDVLKIPNNIRVVALSPFGYPDENPPARKRKNLDEIVCYNYYK